MSLSLIAYSGEKKHSNVRLLSLIALLAVSTLINVLMIQRVYTLGQTITQLKNGNRLAIGATVSALEAQSLDGSLVSLRFSEKATPTVIYVFTPQCGWCQRNINNLKALKAAASPRFNFIAVSLTEAGLEEYVRQQAFDFPVLSKLSDSTKRAFHLGSTPQTLVIGNDNRVLKNWTGVYTGAQQKEVEDYFNVSLPGLIEAPALH